MGTAKIVNVGVDTLVLNAFYIDERARPVKCELDPSLRSLLDEWKRVVRLGSQYLWSCQGILDAIMSAQTFLDELFKHEVYLQVSSVDLCVDVAGWDDVERLDRVDRDFSTEIARKRVKLGLQVAGKT